MSATIAALLGLAALALSAIAAFCACIAAAAADRAYFAAMREGAHHAPTRPPPARDGGQLVLEARAAPQAALEIGRPRA